MKQLWILAVLLILCVGCNDAAGPNEMILAGQGALRDTQSAREAMDTNARYTAQAYSARQNAMLNEAQATAQSIVMARDAMNVRATATVQAAQLIAVQATAQTIELQSTQAAQNAYLSGMTTITAQAYQATTTAQAVMDARDHKNAAISVLIFALFVALFGLIAILFLLGLQVRRVVEARADGAVIQAKRQYLLETSRGLYDSEIGQFVTDDTDNPSEVAVVEQPQTREPTSLETFVLRAQRSLKQGADGWDSDVIPRYDVMGMGASGWMAMTDELAGRGLIVKTTQGTRCASGNLRNLYAQVRQH